MSTDIIIRNVRLSFPQLNAPQEFKTGDGKPRWDATFLVPPGSQTDKDIGAAIRAEAAAAFNSKPGDRKADLFIENNKSNPQKFCYLDGNLREYDGYAGMMALTTHRAAKDRKGNDLAPPLLLGLGGKNDVLPQNTSKIYAGCYVDAKVSIYALSKENPGIFASFSVIQFRKDGEAFSGSTPTGDGFDDLSEGMEEDEADLI